LFAAIIEAGYGWLAVLAAVNTAVSLYYYLRVVVKMYVDNPAVEAPYAWTPAVTAVVVIAVAAVLAIGLLPSPFFALIQGTALLGP
jgi:NADH-quinone oxidoreductase subunit N